jgi:hypothetical protein
MECAINIAKEVEIEEKKAFAILKFSLELPVLE